MRCYFNNGFSYRSVGSEYIPASDEAVFSEFTEVTETMLAEAFPQYLAKKHREELLLEIVALESQQTPRRLREASLTEEGHQWLENLEQQITALRAQI